MTTQHEQLNARLHDLLKRSKRVLLATHEHGDGDAVGSVLALRESLLAVPGVTVDTLVPATVLSQFSFLDGYHTLGTDGTALKPDRYDCVVLLDCGDVKRTHLAEKLFFLGQHRPPVALVDHHQAMFEFRDVTLVDLPIIQTSASSTSELIFRYLDDNRLTISPTMATALLAGIIFDTGGFQNLATTLESLDIAGELLKYGANLRKVVTATLRSKSVGTLQLWGRALSRLEHDPSTGIVSTALTQDDFRECGVGREGAEGVANFLNSLGEGNIVLVLREEEHGMVKGNYRTKKPGIDVREMAKEYGGGGHVKAAGFSVRGTIEKDAHGWSVRRDAGPQAVK